MSKSLILVCDDAGFASVDRGIRMLADTTGMPLCADYLICQTGAAMRAREMARHPLVSVGLHFELPHITDDARVALARMLRASGTTLGDLPDIRSQAMTGAREQLAAFREALGTNPAHISTHGDFNVDLQNRVQPWWEELMHELFEGSPPPMQWQMPHVRHNLYRWNETATARLPRTPDEFARELLSQTSDTVEFVMHPAHPEEGDASLKMLFTAEMRMRDLSSAITLIRSGCIEESGFSIVAISDIDP